MTLRTDYMDVTWDGNRKYKLIPNEDGTVSFEDKTIYFNKEKSYFGAKDINDTNEEVNNKAHKVHKHVQSDIKDFEHRHDVSDIDNFDKLNESDKDLRAFREDALSCMASYIMHEYKSSCVLGYSGDTVAFKYDTNKGYMGLFGRYLDFIYTDKVDNKNVAYMDCAVFTSLILKCRKYEESPYHYAFTTPTISKKELYHRSLENYGMDKSYTLDFLNNLNTGRMIYQAYKAGLHIYHLSERNGVNNTVKYFEDNINKLETGDIIFRGLSSAVTESNKGQIYEGVDHTGIFVKNLSELNTAKGVPSGVTFREVTGQSSNRGYIVEFTGSLDNTGYKDCLRITAFEKWAESSKSAAEWTKLFAVKPISNHMTSNKAHVQATGVLKCYDFDVRVLQEMNGYYYQPCEIIPRIASGWIIKSDEDLNDYCYDGLYQCNQLSVAETLKNTPTTTMNYDLKCIGFNKDGGYGTQIVYCNSNSKNIIYTRTCFTKDDWSPWKQFAMIEDCVKTSGVKGQDGHHQMAMSWDGSKIIVGVDNNAAVKAMVDTSMIDVTRTGWDNSSWVSSNFIVDGSKPWIHQFKREGQVVTVTIDLTLKYQLATGKAWLGIYNIPTQFKPTHLWKELFYSEQNKRYYLEMLQDSTNGLQIKIQPLDVMNVGDRMRITFTYMV